MATFNHHFTEFFTMHFGTAPSINYSALVYLTKRRHSRRLHNEASILFLGAHLCLKMPQNFGAEPEYANWDAVTVSAS